MITSNEHVVTAYPQFKQGVRKDASNYSIDRYIPGNTGIRFNWVRAVMASGMP